MENEARNNECSSALGRTDQGTRAHREGKAPRTAHEMDGSSFNRGELGEPSPGPTGDPEAAGKRHIDPEEAREMFLEFLPETITLIRDMLQDPSTPPSSKVALFNIVLERALGKPELPVHVSTDQDRVMAAEAQLALIVREMQGLIEEDSGGEMPGDGEEEEQS